MKLVKNNPEISSLEDFFAKRPTPKAPKDYKISTLDSDKKVVPMMSVLDYITGNKDRAFVIVGDYDNDGISATKEMELLLRHLGVQNIRVIIPDRKDGYGISKKIIDAIEDDEIIVTVDNGIRAFEPLEYAKGRGLSVILTDHHEPGDCLPEADFIVNPHIPGTADFSDYCGAGVVYKIAELLDDYELLQSMSTLAAIATIADCVSLEEDNINIFLKGIEDAPFAPEGCKEMITAGGLWFRNFDKETFKNNRLPKTAQTVFCRTDSGEYLVCQYRSGKFTDLKSNKIINSELAAWAYPQKELDNEFFFDEETIGFKVSPLFNAPGRLCSHGADMVLEFLSEEDPEKRAELLMALYQVNEDRKLLSSEAFENAVFEIATNGYENDCPLVVAVPNMPSGITGIVAGKLAEKFSRPAIVLSETGEDVLVGSARSPMWFNMIESLDRNAGLLAKYGGHAGAAGLSIKREDIDLLRKALQVSIPASDDAIYYDLEISEEKIAETALLLEEQKPFGAGNPKPVFFIPKFSLTGDEFSGEKAKRAGDGKTLILYGKYCKGVAFDALDFDTKRDSVGIVATLGLNRFNGKVSPQLQILEII